MKTLKKIAVIALIILVSASPVVAKSAKGPQYYATKAWIRTKCLGTNDFGKIEELKKAVAQKDVAAVEAWVACGANPNQKIGADKQSARDVLRTEFIKQSKKIASDDYDAMYAVLYGNDYEETVKGK
jgi:hypothetical protein